MKIILKDIDLRTRIISLTRTKNDIRKCILLIILTYILTLFCSPFHYLSNIHVFSMSLRYITSQKFPVTNTYIFAFTQPVLLILSYLYKLEKYVYRICIFLEIPLRYTYCLFFTFTKLRTNFNNM